jgi:DNA-binding response OmpR family regulator
MKILIVEDEDGIVRMINRGLSPLGHEIVSASSGDDDTIPLWVDQVDLVILDINLPGADGYDVLSRIRRQRAGLPVIMLTAMGDVRSKVAALDGGADDYMVKPFAMEELIARIRANTRRSDQRSASALQFGPLQIDLISHCIRRDDAMIELSRREFALLEYFARNPGRLLTRQQILSAVWEYDFDGESNVVNVYVRYLRQKLAQVGYEHVLSTVHGSGYRFDPPS